MLDSLDEVAMSAAAPHQQSTENIQVNLGGQVGRINLSLKMPLKKQLTGNFASPQNLSQSATSSPSPLHQCSSAQLIYPKGDSVSDQIQIAINVANKVSRQNMSIQQEVASFQRHWLTKAQGPSSQMKLQENQGDALPSQPEISHHQPLQQKSSFLKGSDAHWSHSVLPKLRDSRYTAVNVFGSIDGQRDSFVEFSRQPPQQNQSQNRQLRYNAINTGSQQLLPTYKQSKMLKNSRTLQHDIPQRSFSQIEHHEQLTTALDAIQIQDESAQSLKMIKGLLKRKKNREVVDLALPETHSGSQSVANLNSDLLEQPYSTMQSTSDSRKQQNAYQQHSTYQRPRHHYHSSHRLLQTEKPIQKLKAVGLSNHYPHLQQQRQEYQNMNSFTGNNTHYNSLPVLKNSTSSSIGVALPLKQQRQNFHYNSHLNSALDSGDDIMPALPSLSHILVPKEPTQVHSEKKPYENRGIQNNIYAFQELLHKSAQTVKNNSDELDNVAKPNCEHYQEPVEEVKEPTLPEIKLVDTKKKRMRKKPKQSKSALRPGRHTNCKACHDLQAHKIQPTKYMQDYEKLRHYTQLYSTYVQQGHIMQAEQCISKIKANHPVLFRLRQSTCQYLIKNSRIHFLMEGEALYKYGERIDKAVYILLFGRCKMKFDKKSFGLKMGTGYTFNEEALFIKSDLATLQHTETLQTTEESAFLRVSVQTFREMTDLEGLHLVHGSSPHMMDDQDLLWELFERHYFVKSTLRQQNNLIDEMPPVRSADQNKRETLQRRRRNSPSKRPIQLPLEAQKIVKTLKKRSPSSLRLL